MALYWPHHNVALEIVDDPHSLPVDRDAFPHINVISTTCAEISDPAASERLMRRLAHEMGIARPAETPGELVTRRNLLRELDRALRLRAHLPFTTRDEAVETLDRELTQVEREHSDASASTSPDPPSEPYDTNEQPSARIA